MREGPPQNVAEALEYHKEAADCDPRLGERLSLCVQEWRAGPRRGRCNGCALLPGEHLHGDYCRENCDEEMEKKVKERKKGPQKRERHR